VVEFCFEGDELMYMGWFFGDWCLDGFDVVDFDVGDECVCRCLCWIVFVLAVVACCLVL